jgi:hypothetical protein
MVHSIGQAYSALYSVISLVDEGPLAYLMTAMRLAYPGKSAMCRQVTIGNDQGLVRMVGSSVKMEFSVSPSQWSVAFHTELRQDNRLCLVTN